MAQQTNQEHSEQHTYGHKHPRPTPPPYRRECSRSRSQTASDHVGSRNGIPRYSLRTSQSLRRKKSLNHLTITVRPTGGIRVDNLLLAFHGLGSFLFRLGHHFLDLFLAIPKFAPCLFEWNL